MRKFLRLFVLLCTALLLRGSAATITWTSPINATLPTDVLNTGTLVAAEGSFGGGPVIINGVSFAPVNTAGNEIELTGTNASFGSTNTGSAAYDTLLSIGFFSPGDGSLQALNLSGLTIGADYRIQIWTPAWNNNFPTSFIAGNTLDMANDATTPRFAFGTFTADATTQTIFYHGSFGSHGLVAGAALFTNVPEPSAWALLGLGGVCVAAGAWFRKRRRV